MNGPVKVYSEINAVRLHADELAALGRRALIVTGGGSSRKNGSLDDVISALSSPVTVTSCIYIFSNRFHLVSTVNGLSAFLNVSKNK